MTRAARQQRRIFVLGVCLALMATLFGTLGPLILGVASRGAPASTFDTYTIICTPNGVRMIPNPLADADQVPAPASATYDCPLCQTAFAIKPPGDGTGVSFQGRQTEGAWPSSAPALVEARDRHAFQARGPPHTPAP